MRNDTEMSSEIPNMVQYTHSVKIEDSAKGIRISVHVYANNQASAINDAFETYMACRLLAKEKNIPLAPVEVNGK